jgi:Mor family transcriptional regulator
MLDHKVVKSIIEDLQKNIYTIKELAKKYDVSGDTVRNLNKGLVKTALGYYDGTYPISDCIVPVSKRIVADYETGMKIDDIFEKYDVSFSRLKSILKMHESSED